MAASHQAGTSHLVEVFKGGTEEELLEKILEWYRSFGPEVGPMFQGIRWDFLSTGEDDKSVEAVVTYIPYLTK